MYYCYSANQELIAIKAENNNIEYQLIHPQKVSSCF